MRGAIFSPFYKEAYWCLLLVNYLSTLTEGKFHQFGVIRKNNINVNEWTTISNLFQNVSLWCISDNHFEQFNILFSSSPVLWSKTFYIKKKPNKLHCKKKLKVCNSNITCFISRPELWIKSKLMVVTAAVIYAIKSIFKFFSQIILVTILVNSNQVKKNK